MSTKVITVLKPMATNYQAALREICHQHLLESQYHRQQVPKDFKTLTLRLYQGYSMEIVRIFSSKICQYITLLLCIIIRIWSLLWNIVDSINRVNQRGKIIW